MVFAGRKLVGWLIDKETVTDTIDVYGSTLCRSFEPWQLLPPRCPLGCCQLTYENDFRFDCAPPFPIPHSPLHHQQPHPSIECQLVDCLPNCHSLFPFPIKALANSFESAAPEFLPLFVLLVKGYCWNDFCNCCRGLIIINRLINDRLIVHFIKGTHCHFFLFFWAPQLLIYWKHPK